MKKKKYNILLLSILCSILNTESVKAEHYVEINKYYQQDLLEPFASYENGNIYIGNDIYLDMISEFASDTDILIKDERFDTDPNFKIYNSYKILDGDVQDEVIEVLYKYNELYPSEWNRTYNSLKNEWYFHNLMHSFNYHTYQTTDVDFNNYDENNYNSITPKKIYRNFKENKKR